MKTLIAFLMGMLFLVAVAVSLPDTPQEEPIDGKIAECSLGSGKLGTFAIAIIYYEGRAEYYLDTKVKFAVVVQEGNAVKIYIRLPDGTVKSFGSTEEAEAAVGLPCEVALL